MSTKNKNITPRTVSQRTQIKPRRTTSEQKSDSSRNVKDKKDEKQPKNDPTKLNPLGTKEKTKTAVKEPQKLTKKGLHPLAAKQSTKTPTSQNDRVSKSKFFPTKNNYAEMLQFMNKYEVGAGDGTKKTKAALRKTITSPRKTSSLEEDTSEPNSTSERPRTSTLRKGSIVNENIAGPEAPKKSPSKELKDNTDDIQEEADYEDDFDSYESDFENVSSSDSTIHNLSEISTETTSSSEEDTSKAATSIDKDLEKKLDSGNFEMNENRTKQDLTHLQDLVDRDNMKLIRPSSNARSNLTSLSDEGFEEAKSLQFLNFVSAKKRNERRRSMEIRKRRGEELLNMIRLDCINFTIFDTPSVPYEDFIKAFGNVNCMQVGVQTGEELVDEEIQTESVETCEKWVQMPPYVSKDSPVSYRFERVGVGPPLDHLEELEETPQFSESRLSKFLSNTGGLILHILKEQSSRYDSLSNKNPESSLSEAVTSFKPPTEFSGKRKLERVVSNPRNPSVFLSVHVDEESGDFCKSMMYLWNVNEVLPELYMTCFGRVTSCCFGFDGRTVIAGLHDGSLVLWETTNNTSISENVYRMVEGDVSLKSPIFVTDVEKSHCSPVVAVSCVSESNIFDVFDEMESTWKVSKQTVHSLQYCFNDKHRWSGLPEAVPLLRVKRIAVVGFPNVVLEDPLHCIVCSLDQEGTILVWSVIVRQNLDITQNGGNPSWEGTILMKNFEVLLQNVQPGIEELLCNDMFVSRDDPRAVFIATNNGTVLQCDLNKVKAQVKVYTSSETVSPVKCLAACPFSDTFFLSGQENGSIFLYSRKCPTPLMVLTNKDSGTIDDSIDEIQWSSEKPCVFYTKNSRNVIDAWDLSISSLFPMESLSFDAEISCMKLTMSRHEKSYMLIAKNNTIQAHLLSKDHRRKNEEQYNKEMKTFLTYVSRL